MTAPKLIIGLAIMTIILAGISICGLAPPQILFIPSIPAMLLGAFCIDRSQGRRR